MVIALTPEQFKQLNTVIEASRRAMASSPEGELTLAEDGHTDRVEWDEEQVRITLST